tara:strand:- start:1816 stop:2904 length:1089 start_codon:yes stop_codon:yes gene_type:complete
MNKTYCTAPFHQIYCDNGGRYRLCCHGGVNKTIAKYKSSTHTPFEYFLSDEMEQIRQDMVEGKKIDGCESCYKIEDAGHESWRQWKYNKLYEHDTVVNRVGLKLRINGSYCNLSCYMCFPYNSSTRRNELKQIGADWKKYDAGYVGIKSGQYERITKDILKHIDLVDYMNITGGEPIQLPKHWDLIDSIPHEHAKNITLSYDTNLTELTYKNRSIFEVAEKFKAVRLGVSCDHYGKKLSWMRYPIDVEKFEKNLVEAKTLVTQLNCTVSLLNIHDVADIYHYYKTNFDIETTFVNVVIGPDILSIKNLPDKDKLIEKYKNYNMIVQELKKPSDDDQYKKALDYCQTLSDHRKFQHKHLWQHL